MLAQLLGFFSLRHGTGEPHESVLVRLAKWHDYDRLLAFYAQHGQDLLLRGPFERLRTRARLRLFDRTQVRIIYLEDGEANIIAAGMVSGRQTPREFVGEIDYILVHPTMRGRGLSRALMNQLHEEAEAMGITKLRLTSEPHHTAARTLYASMGYQLTEGSDRHYTYTLPKRE